MKTDFLRALHENERHGNDCYLAAGGHGGRGDCWLPSLAEMSFEEVQRNVEMRMNDVDDLESQMVQPQQAPSDATDDEMDGAVDLL